MTNDLVKQFDRKGAFATYNLIDALSRNPTTIYAGADICAEAKSTILVQADRIEELEAKLAKAMEGLEDIADGMGEVSRTEIERFAPAVARTTLAELTRGNT